MLYRICELVYTSSGPVHSAEVVRALGIMRGYAYTLVDGLRKWGVLEAVRDPENNKTAFKTSTRKVLQPLAGELRKRRTYSFRGRSLSGRTRS